MLEFYRWIPDHPFESKFPRDPGLYDNHLEFYFADLEHIFTHWNGEGKVALVTLSNPTETGDWFTCDTFQLEDIISLHEWNIWKENDLCLLAVKQKGDMLAYIKNPTKEICLVALQCTGNAIQFIKDPDEEMCLTAVRQDPWVLEFIKHQTVEICLAALLGNGMLLQFVHDQTPELCMVAVMTCGLALKFVKQQTPAICIQAVKHDGMALEHVINKTSEMCILAKHQNRNACTYFDSNFNSS